MSKILISKLKTGMKLAKPVKNDSGMILLGENTELTESLIQRLEKMNIESVAIVSDKKLDRPLEVMLAELDARFRKTEKEPHMGMLKKVFQEHLREMAK